MTREDRTLGALRIVIGPPPRDLTPTASLRDDLGMDDLDVVELVVELEQAFGIEVTEEEGDALETWGNVLKLMHQKQKSQKVDNHEILVPGQAQAETAAGRVAANSISHIN